MNKMKIYQVDSFTTQAFAGNPAAVCVIAGDAFPSPEWMLNVASEMNLSETAFVLPKEDQYLLRWFTPTVEVDLCGHATLATAHILWEQGYANRATTLKFKTRSGQLLASLQDDWINLDFPAELEQESPPPPLLLEALGVPTQYIGKNRMDYLVLVGSEQEVTNLQPNFELLKQIGTRGIIVTARARTAQASLLAQADLSAHADFAPKHNSPYDFVSRFFCPSIGINEDPVTGSAHCCLAPFWSDRLGRSQLLGYQASKRGGYVKTKVSSDRVILGGQAVTILSGVLQA